MKVSMIKKSKMKKRKNMTGLTTFMDRDSIHTVIHMTISLGDLNLLLEYMQATKEFKVKI
jgi:hypothetical protein